MKAKQLIPLAITSTLLSTAAFAHDTSCDMELEGNIQYHHGLLTVDMNNGGSFSIDETHTLTINGERADLDRDQQAWVSTYYDNIDTAIPMTLNIASEGLEIASLAVTEVFGELLGADSSLTNDFDTLFVSLNDKLNYSFYDENGDIHVDSTRFDEPGWFDESWEAEFEEEIESLVAKSMGHILVAIGTQMLWEGGDMDAFEQKMERFGETIEHRIETQAASLEEKGHALCEVLKQADYAESKMAANIPGLDALNLLDIDSSEMRM